MKKVAVYGQYLHDGAVEVIEILIDSLISANYQVVIEKQFKSLIESESALQLTADSFTTLDSDCNFLISIGGDGTILRAVSYVGESNIPVLGINTGRLGFLATVQKEHINKVVEMLENQNYTLSKRSLIIVESIGGEGLNEPINFALNEAAVSRMNTTSMIQIETKLNDELLTSYWADGLIIATPTGSTGYSLSCGGPVISPDTQALVITPIAPHNLNARPFVIPDSTKISIRIRGREDHFLLSLDNRISSIANDTTITLQRAKFTIDLIQLNENTFINTIRKKLLWGEDLRN